MIATMRSDVGPSASPPDSPPASVERKPQLPIMTVLGMLALMWSASVYSAFGLSAYPRQEWLLETLVSIVFVIPVINLLKGPGSFSHAVRAMGVMLLAHSIWDALHWPGSIMINTPIDPRIPMFCPFSDIPLGLWLLIRGK
jgi:hypothetical protein